MIQKKLTKMEDISQRMEKYTIYTNFQQKK